MWQVQQETADKVSSTGSPGVDLARSPSQTGTLAPGYSGRRWRGRIDTVWLAQSGHWGWWAEQTRAFLRRPMSSPFFPHGFGQEAWSQSGVGPHDEKGCKGAFSRRGVVMRMPSLPVCLLPSGEKAEDGRISVCCQAQVMGTSMSLPGMAVAAALRPSCHGRARAVVAVGLRPTTPFPPPHRGRRTMALWKSSHTGTPTSPSTLWMTTHHG